MLKGHNFSFFLSIFLAFITAFYYIAGQICTIRKRNKKNYKNLKEIEKLARILLYILCKINFLEYKDE